MLGWCFSNNGDVSWLFRRHAIFSEMIVNHGLRTITKKHDAKLDPIQKEILLEAGNISSFFFLFHRNIFIFIVKDPSANVCLKGSSGSGKTVIGTEIVKTKVSHFKAEDIPVTVIVTEYHDQPTQLIENMKTHFENIENVSVLTFSKLCEKLNIECDYKYPKKMMNQIIKSLEANTEENYIFLCDELDGCNKYQRSADWTEVCTADNVSWILLIRPDGFDDMNNLILPSGANIISRKLRYCYRNCHQIRSVVVMFSLFYSRVFSLSRQYIIWFISHNFKERYINMEDDVLLEAKNLPAGKIPLWIDFPRGISQRAILEKISKLGKC